MVVTDALRAALRELIANPSNPAISTDDANRLIELGLAAPMGKSYYDYASRSIGGIC